MFGRSLMSMGARGLGNAELADSLKPISIDDAMRLSVKELDIPLGQALINARGKFSVPYGNVTMANLKDPEGVISRAWSLYHQVRPQGKKPTDGT